MKIVGQLGEEGAFLLSPIANFKHPGRNEKKKGKKGEALKNKIV